ncbi:hypothetical protein GEMRC1_006257 [Eukaryota sp. GEM-RC1]
MFHLDCVICESLFKDACSLPCGHCFCLPCITKWIELNQSCPFCRQTASLADIVACYALREAADALANNPAALPEIASEELSFNLNDELGSGISGTVYLCEWADTDVALKLVRKADQNEARLLQEVSHMASLSHPFVLRVFGITRLPQHIGILMELGSGHLQVPTSLSPTTLAQAIDICSALKYLHSKGIYHHDIKPQNVILVNSQVKLADFGSSNNNSATSSLQMSPKYTAPESFKKVFGSAFDVYSLGILFYEMFANRLAFEGMGVLEVVTAKQQEHLLSFPEGFPVPISSLINKCLSVNPNERPSISDVLKEMKDIQGNIKIHELNNSIANALQIENSNHELPFEGYQEAAERGDAEAMVNLGNCFLNGIGVNKNQRQAVYWFLEAHSKGNSSARTNLGKTIHWSQHHAKLGDQLAMTALGYCYHFGEGISRDLSLAVHWFQKAAYLGHSTAMYSLAVCLKNGIGVEKDSFKAVHWFQKGADLGDSSSMYDLGVCLHGGDGIPKDQSQAVHWFEMAADLGSSHAMYNLGICFDNGLGVARDQSRAVFWFQKAAESSHSIAMYNLGVALDRGIGIEQDHTKAAYWFEKAADSGHVDAMYNLGICYGNGRGVQLCKSQAAELYQKAANLSHVKAMFNIGVCYHVGSGIKQDYSKSVHWFKKAADSGYVDAMHNLGVCYKYGEGVLKDKSEAYNWFKKAADLGHLKAKDSLGSLYEHEVETPPVDEHEAKTPPPLYEHEVETPQEQSFVEHNTNVSEEHEVPSCPPNPDAESLTSKLMRWFTL